MSGRPIPPWTGFAFLCVAWSTSWLAIKIGYAGLDAVWSAAARFLLGGAILLIIQAVRRIPFPTTSHAWTTSILVGIVFFFGEYAPLYWGQQFLSSGLGAVLFSSTALFAAVIGWVTPGGERPSGMQLSGTLLGITGLVFLFHKQVGLGDTPWYGPAAILLAGFAAAAGTVIIRRRQRQLHPVALNAPAMLVGGALLGATSILIGEHPSLPRNGAGWASILYLAGMSTVAGFLVYAWLLKHWTAHRASTITLAVPPIALAIGRAVAGETISPFEVGAAALVLTGVGVVLWSRVPKAGRRPVVVAAR